MKQKHILKIWRTLKAKQPYMDSFMKNYMLRQIGIPRNKMLASKENYMSVIDFCLKTRRTPNSKKLKAAENYFNRNYENFKSLLREGNYKALKELVEKAKGNGVGQKIEAFILEVFIFYGKLGKRKLLKDLYVPLDSHTIRMFDEALDLESVPKKNISKKKVDKFQDELKRYIPKNGERIYFDYLWYIGKVFCQKINNGKNTYSRGFRLCNDCWIKNNCQIKDKWKFSN
ncbi:hypothetical protein ACSSV9_14465 [Melioribacter sp. OK-6-Me]|uniref:hypothetical protein n=1 Tax=Melioribacter sp. OK-6-Me TaxID=3423433 RepID=UPI003ED8F063